MIVRRRWLSQIWSHIYIRRYPCVANSSDVIIHNTFIHIIAVGSYTLYCNALGNLVKVIRNVKNSRDERYTKVNLQLIIQKFLCTHSQLDILRDASIFQQNYWHNKNKKQPAKCWHNRRKFKQNALNQFNSFKLQQCTVVKGRKPLRNTCFMLSFRLKKIDTL